MALPHLGQVVDVQDPQRMGRVRVRLFAFDGTDGQDAPVWARVAVPFAGADYGAVMIPNVDDEVLVVFAGGDARQPVVVGSLWNGGASPPAMHAGDRVDRWLLVGRAGTRIAIVEEAAGTARIRLETPNGVSGELTDADGGRIEFRGAGTTITADTSGVKVTSPGTVEVQASQVKISAGMVTVDAGMSKFSGVVKCDALISNAVISTSYTPGAGNIW
jgi:uncharacterized protein involved in type VI secretion and phage assembly